MSPKPPVDRRAEPPAAGAVRRDGGNATMTSLDLCGRQRGNGIGRARCRRGHRGVAADRPVGWGQTCDWCCGASVRPSRLQGSRADDHGNLPQIAQHLRRLGNVLSLFAA